MKIGQFSDSFLPVVDGVGRVVSNYARVMGDQCESCYVIAPQTPDTVLQTATPAPQHLSPSSEAGTKSPQGSTTPPQNLITPQRQNLTTQPQQNCHSPLTRSYELIEFRGITLPFLKQYRIGFPALDRRFRRQMAQTQLDIVHAHDPFMAGHEAIRVARRQGIPVVGTFHSKYSDDFQQVTHSKTLARWGVHFIVSFYTKCDQVWTVSNSAADVLRAYGYKGAIEVVENGTDRIEADPEIVRMVSECYGLGELPVLLFVGQMNWKKNVRRILEAVKILVEQGRALKLVLAGQGPSEPEIRALAAAMGLGKLVVFTGHVSDPQVLHGLYARANLLVFPSLYDTAGLVVSEAAALGTPALLVAGSSAAEAVKDGENGFLAKDTPQDLAERIAWALEHPDRLREIGQAARMSIPRPWKDVVAGVLDRYEELIASYESRQR